MTLADKVSKRVLVINGSYREGGITDQIVGYACAQLHSAGAETEVIELRSYPIEFCLNCRECMQSPGDTPGHCVIDDGMAHLVERIEAADAYIFAAPTNFSSVSAVFKRFMERLAVYGYWPWGQAAPKYRKAGLAPKKALLISSSATPGFLGRWLFGSGGQLRIAAKTIGARPIGLVFSGMASQQKNPRLPRQTIAATQSMLRKLLS